MTDHLPKGQFNWDAMKIDDRLALIDHTKHLHHLERKTSIYLIDIGRTLTDVKRMLKHGDFLLWLADEFQWSESSANRFMQVFRVFGEEVVLTGLPSHPESKSVNLTDLPEWLTRAQPSAIYALAAASCPAEVREEFVARAEAGERVRYGDVKERIARHRDEQEAEPEPIDEPVIPSPAQAHSTTLAPIPSSSPKGPRLPLAGMATTLEQLRRQWRTIPDWMLEEIEEGSEDADALEAIASSALAIHDRIRAIQKANRKARMRVVQ